MPCSLLYDRANLTVPFISILNVFLPPCRQCKPCVYVCMLTELCYLYPGQYLGSWQCGVTSYCASLYLCLPRSNVAEVRCFYDTSTGHKRRIFRNNKIMPLVFSCLSVPRVGVTTWCSAMATDHVSGMGQIICSDPDPP